MGLATKLIEKLTADEKASLYPNKAQNVRELGIKVLLTEEHVRLLDAKADAADLLYNAMEKGKYGGEAWFAYERAEADLFAFYLDARVSAEAEGWRAR